MKKIVLFKGVSEDYEKAFSESDYEVMFIEPLQFEYINITELNEKLQLNTYDGIIFTSPRAVDAVSKCWSPSKFVLWNTKRVYTVGEATANKIKLSLGLEAVGATSGNAENLANMISKENMKHSTFLFPCGNLRSEILPSVLQSHDIKVDTITVYETKENEKLRSNLMELNDVANLICMVFFSPSGCEYIYREFQTFTNKLSNLPHFAIGNSTAHKIENLGIEIAGVATKPKAECVLESVEQYFRTLEQCG